MHISIFFVSFFSITLTTFCWTSHEPKKQKKSIGGRVNPMAREFQKSPENNDQLPQIIITQPPQPYAEPKHKPRNPNLTVPVLPDIFEKRHG